MELVEFGKQFLAAFGQGAQAAAAVASVKERFDSMFEMLAGIKRDLGDVAKGQYKLQAENDELKQLHAAGFLEFVRRVEGNDFRVFAVIMSYGNPNAAAQFLEIPRSSLYDLIQKWKNKGGDYPRMLRLIEWRKKVSRTIKARLGESVLFGEAGNEGENPKTLNAVLEKLRDGCADNRSYPEIFREILEVLQSQNAANWQSVREDLVDLVKAEIAQ